MNIIPKATPTPAQPQQSSKADARARAVAMIQSQANPVANPSNVSPEELSAVRAPSTPNLGQNSTNEAPAAPEAAQVEATKAPTKEEPPLSRQYAILARKEKAIRTQAQELKAREEAVRVREEAVKATPSFDESKYIARDKLKAETLSVLANEGITYDELTNQILNTPKQDPATQAYLQRLEAKIAELEGKTQSVAKSYEEQQTQQYNQAVNQIRTEAKQLILSDSSFETIKETNSLEDVVDLIKRTFEEDGVVMSVEEAAKAVEDHLVEEAIKIAKLSKIQKRLSPAAQPPQKLQDPKQPQMKTLTNAVGTSRPLTAKERAVLAFKGEKF